MRRRSGVATRSVSLVSRLLPPAVRWLWGAIGLLATLAVACTPAAAQSSGSASQLTLDGNLLTRTGTAVGLRLTGSLAAPLASAEMVVRVLGPGDPRTGALALPEAGAARVEVGDLPATVELDVPIEASWIDAPGAYRVDVALESGGVRRAEAGAWLGRIAADAPTVDLAVVIPCARGIWQEPGGAFVGGVMQQAVSPAPGSEGSLYPLLEMAAALSGARFTLAVEPVLLTQLEDLQDGYTARDTSGAVVQLYADDAAASGARNILVGLRSLATRDGIQILPLPYAVPSLPQLAARGWPDGVEQMRLGKAEVIRLLGPVDTLRGALAPALELSTDSMASYSQAAVDYVVVGASVLKDLAETPKDVLAPVRVTDTANNRLTVVPVSTRVGELFGVSGRADELCATIADILAGAPRTALTVCAGDEYREFDVPSALEFLRQVEVSGAFTTVTVDELVRSHAPDRRPLYLSRYAAYPEGLIAATIAQEIDSVHPLVTDYLKAADVTAPQASAVAALLFRAESRHWLREELNPEQAGLAVQYARTAGEVVRQELARVRLRGGRIEGGGSTGSALVTVENSAVYAWNLVAELRTSDGAHAVIASETVRAQPGLTEVRLPASRLDCEVQLLAGSTVVASAELDAASSWWARFWMWPAAAAAVMVSAAAVFLLRRRHGPTGRRSRPS